MDPLSVLFVATSVISLIQMAEDAIRAGNYKDAAEIRSEISRLETQASNDELKKINELDRRLRSIDNQQSNLFNTVRGSKADQLKEKLSHDTVSAINESNKQILDDRETVLKKSTALERLAKSKENKPTIIQNVLGGN